MKVTLKINKAKAKSNITASISRNQDQSFRSWNFTGTMIELEGFVSSDGINYDKELVGLQVGTTVIVTNEALGEAIYEKCADIFAKRANVGDLNPSIDLHLECNTVQPKESNILVSNVNTAYVKSNTSLRDNSAKVIDALASLRKASANNAQVNAARLGMTNVMNKVMSSVKTYL